MLEVWLPLLFVAVIVAWWYQALRSRERAIAHARDLCERHGLQLLDDSVALRRLRMSWRHGGLRVTREYRFDTSLGGNDRRPASIVLLGDHVVSASVPEREAPAASAPVSPYGDLPARAASGTTPGDNIVPITRRTLH
ncbi:MAG TPA: DUF3301 domain-containing protein [Rhodanobacteraceae bacterium]|jgi:hypothetical protein|nr:DUF3301 domain-containing protein [Rhodanobacteraceae bacterium]